MPIFVNINLTSGANDGSSWENAFQGSTALQEALGTNPNNDNEIWVAQGVYIPSQGWDVDNGTTSVVPRTESFRIPNECRVYGGFNGTETLLDQRNIDANPTTLSGNLGDMPATNAYHVVFFYRVEASTVLDGFTVTNGRATGVLPHRNGGGIYNNGRGAGALSNPTVNNCVFSNNSATLGGAIYNDGSSSGASSPSFIACTFSNNLSSTSGAVYNNGALGISSPNFKNCVFSDNSANNGGAIYNRGSSGVSSPNFENCVFFDNSANNGGAVYNDALANGTSSPSFINVTFFNNTATSFGTIMYNVAAENPTITDSILIGNYTLTNPLIRNPNNTTINYSKVAGGWIGTGSNNIDEDPLFINSANPIGPDNIWMTNDDGLALQPCSPCLGAGTSIGSPSIDIIGNNRPSPPSMGAYETPLFSIDSSVLTVDCLDNEATLTLSGVNNESLLWQYSEDNGITWLDTNNTSYTYIFNNLTINTLFRVKVTTTDCPNSPLYSEIANVTVNDNCTTIQITTTSLSNGVVNVPYYAILSQSGGVDPVTWSILEETQVSNNIEDLTDNSHLIAQATYTGLPPGLRLNALTGEISGIPTLAGSFNFTVQVIDSVNNVATRTYNILIILLPSNDNIDNITIKNTEIIESTKLHDWMISSRGTNIRVDFES